MPDGKVVVFMGSERDFEFASRIGKFLQNERFGVGCDYIVASAHKTPRKLLGEIKKRESCREPSVYISVAGLSDALSGVVAGSTKHPVIACPPDSEKFWWAKAFSSAMTPQGVAVAYVPRPENAALFAVKILSLSERDLERKVELYMRKLERKTSQKLARESG
jgi:5-(carboxyamino)imidazole ribonucleotide mutase